MFGNFIKVSCPLCGEEIFLPVEIQRIILDKKVVLKLKKEAKMVCQACRTRYRILVFKEIVFVSRSFESNHVFSSGALFFPCLYEYCRGRIRVPVIGDKAYPVFPSLKEANRRKKETEIGLLSLRFGGRIGECDSCGEAGEVLPIKIYFEITKVPERGKQRVFA
ncbi:MAG: hypothetical protein PHH24_03710 [Candidatus Moranbacteria bacterium]|jgi:hypothetical protein|nr:hypothetical protein [Candidatus Moranbacteria bacterium]MDD5652017.1 hypothetical protein [Candidatus Moranbacteria bacterium]MDX9856016.1 hypothetical protein [Candidatus Moranbacteria bacterium]